MIPPGGGCRLQTCRGLAAQWFDSTLRTSEVYFCAFTIGDINFDALSMKCSACQLPPVICRRIDLAVVCAQPTLAPEAIIGCFDKAREESDGVGGDIYETSPSISYLSSGSHAVVRLNRFYNLFMRPSLRDL
jgi:hypothetical protein